VTSDQVTRLQNSAPFKPYLILLADGRSIHIRHPDFVSVSDKEQLLFVYDLRDNVEIIDLLLVVSLRYGSSIAVRKRR
jgi:hypothetical protein